MSDCIFCKIINGDIPADIIYENDHVIAFRDINPQAPTHALVIPKKHIPTLNDVEPEDAAILGELILGAKAVAALDGLSERGYRVAMNCNEDAGQTVFHIHMHVLGGLRMGWPPFGSS